MDLGSASSMFLTTSLSTFLESNAHTVADFTENTLDVNLSDCVIFISFLFVCHKFSVFSLHRSSADYSFNRINEE